jgi:hypothetical protein
MSLMSASEEEYLLELWSRNICPNCGNQIPEGQRLGDGQKRNGGFCTFDCYVRYYQGEMVERQRRLLERLHRHQQG